MTHHEWDTAFIDAFILKEKRDRYRMMLANPKKRRAFLDRLNHHHDFLPHLIKPLNPQEEVLPKLADNEGSETVYLISDNDELDGRTLTASEALTLLHAQPWGSIAYNFQRHRAYYYGENAETRFLLIK